MMMLAARPTARATVTVTSSQAQAGQSRCWPARRPRQRNPYQNPDENVAFNSGLPHRFGSALSFQLAFSDSDSEPGRETQAGNHAS